MAAAESGNAAEMKGLLGKSPDGRPSAQAFYQRDSDGQSVLMAAAASGEMAAVTLLLERGAPWNAVDRKAKCAGEYAIEAGHQHVVDALVDAGVRAELILSALGRNRRAAEAKKGGSGAASGSCSDAFLTRGVRYEKDRLMDEADDAVMMEWETPIMQAHADMLVPVEGEGDVLNIGFGMGIIDRFIQARKPRTHTIVEAHPEVYKRMLADGWDKKPGVRILFGRWQDVLPAPSDGEAAASNDSSSVTTDSATTTTAPATATATTTTATGSTAAAAAAAAAAVATYDGIFYDTYGEYDSDMRDLHKLLPQILRPGGLYSFFNGLCPGNIFFHGVACQVVKLELKSLGGGVDAEFLPCEFAGPQLDSEQWKGVRRSYYWSDTYYLPMCRMPLPKKKAAHKEKGAADGATKKKAGVAGKVRKTPTASPAPDREGERAAADQKDVGNKGKESDSKKPKTA